MVYSPDPWKGRTQRDVRIVRPDATGYVDDSHPLPVKADLVVGDIEIGAVELKNATTDDRVNVIPAQTFPTVGDKAVVTTGQAKIFDSDGNAINASNPLTTQVVGGISGQVFSATLATFTATNSLIDNPVFLLNNPIGSGKTCKVISIITGMAEQNRSGIFTIYAGPAVTWVGTIIPVQNRDLSSLITGVILSYESPVLSDNGTSFQTIIAGQNANTFDTDMKQTLVLGEGDKVLITCKPSDNNSLCTLTLIWMEV